MNNKLKLIFSATLAAMILGPVSVFAAANPSSTNAGCGGHERDAVRVAMTALFGDPVIAKGKGVEVKQSALDEVVTGIKSAAAARNQTIPPQQLLGIESQMLEAAHLRSAAAAKGDRGRPGHRPGKGGEASDQFAGPRTARRRRLTGN